MKYLFTFLTLFIFSAFAGAQGFFDFKIKDINGDSVDLSIYKGKKIMVVNTASACGYTPQYADLQQLYDQYKNKGFVVIAFPSNDFNQEQGSDQDILNFCTSNYNITFPLMSKIKVTGPDAAPVYKFMTQKSLNNVMDINVQWNFFKILINEDGSVRDYMTSAGSPSAPKVTQWLDEGADIPEQLARLDAFKIYPSPATSEFTVDLAVSVPSFIKLCLLNATGQHIELLFEGFLEKELTTQYFTDKLKTGVYILMLEIDGLKHSIQFRINK